MCSDFAYSHVEHFVQQTSDFLLAGDILHTFHSEVGVHRRLKSVRQGWLGWKKFIQMATFQVHHCIMYVFQGFHAFADLGLVLLAYIHSLWFSICII